LCVVHSHTIVVQSLVPTAADEIHFRQGCQPNFWGDQLEVQTHSLETHVSDLEGLTLANPGVRVICASMGLGKSFWLRRELLKLVARFPDIRILCVTCRQQQVITPADVPLPSIYFVTWAHRIVSRFSPVDSLSNQPFNTHSALTRHSPTTHQHSPPLTKHAPHAKQTLTHRPLNTP
jgi:hypothetical protein